MAHRRWLVPWKNSCENPAIYHCVARVVDKRFAFEDGDKEQFRFYMRMMEKFSGCQVLAYCVMGNHFHLMLEVTRRPDEVLTDEELLTRLQALYSEAFVATVAKELSAVRKVAVMGTPEDIEANVQRIHRRFTYRMHDLSEFMKTLLQRFTRWHNTRTKRCGNLWEETFKSTIVEAGFASKTVAAYIDLNPVRAGITNDPAEYRWSSYGEAMGATGRSGVRARAGLVRALRAHNGWVADVRKWPGEVSRSYRMLLLEQGVEKTEEVVIETGETEVGVKRKGMRRELAAAEMASLQGEHDLTLGKMLHCRVRYFADGAVIGSREFVEAVFQESRERFGLKRKNGARSLRGNGLAAYGRLWSIRDLKKEV